MAKKKTTASGMIFESAVHVMSDVIDFSIEQHAEAVDAVKVYLVMRETMAEMRRNLRGLLKKGWFKGPEREKCLERARELREAELTLGCLVKISQASAEMHSAFLDNAGDFPGMPELMSHFKVKAVGKRKK
ncbi:MAG: hypothetical protein Q7R35_17875 [Elusimicrobiota bacterium]|nr:hypothetical protein [Elusimicrobiota bacterium]